MPVSTTALLYFSCSLQERPGTGATVSRGIASANIEPSPRPSVPPPSRTSSRAARRLALRAAPGLLQMVEQRDDAVGRRFRHRVGDVAPASVQAAGGDRVLLIDLPDLPAIGAEQGPAHRDFLLALVRPRHPHPARHRESPPARTRA